MDANVKRIGYLPRKRVLEIIDKISESESISRSKVVGILVEEALDARGIANFGFLSEDSLDNKKISQKLNNVDTPKNLKESGEGNLDNIFRSITMGSSS